MTSPSADTAQTYSCAFFQVSLFSYNFWYANSQTVSPLGNYLCVHIFWGLILC